MPNPTSRIRLLVLLFALCLPQLSFAADDEAGLIEWQKWSPDLFARARQQQRMIIMDLEAVWCHWCHVMEAKTYSHADVAQLINEHFIPVRVDADANPDIAARYGRWGWPATIVFSANGDEIVKRRGYIPIIGMLSMLEAIIADPSPGPSVWNEPKATPSNQAALASGLRARLEQAFFDLYDPNYGGWGRIHRFVNSPATEYALEQARIGKCEYELMARLTLHNGLRLIDPEWGGVYQYSDRFDWLSPHFEKIMFYQAENLRLYSLAYSRWRDESFLEAANAVFRYLEDFMLDPGGGYYTSQDADLSLEVDGHAFFALGDRQRRALGMPRIDKNIYTRENAWLIRALLDYYNAGGNPAARQRALDATRYIIAERSLPGGGFSHGDSDGAGPYLGDNQAMLQAFVALYQNTGDKRWLKRIASSLEFIETQFRNPQGGYNSAAVEPASDGVFAEPFRQVDEIAALARSANIAYHHIGSETAVQIREHAMRFLAAPELSEQFSFQPAILLADYELNTAPVHITIIGAKSDATAAELFAAARVYPASYMRLDWWDRSEGPIPNNSIVYPKLGRAAAFVCSNNACSLPLYSAAEIAPKVAELYALSEDG